MIDFIGNFARSAKEGLSIYRISGGAGFLWVASYDQRGRGTLRFATIDPSAIHSTPLPREAQRSDPQSKPQDAESPSAERANVGADVARRDVAIQEADKAIEKTKTNTDFAREGSETRKRDAQLARTEIERLNAEGAKLTAALERLETEKIAAEAKAHTMESVAYGGIALVGAREHR